MVDYTRFHLMDEHLHLDPETLQTIAEIEARMAVRQGIDLWLRPNWQTITPTWHSMLTLPAPAPRRSPWGPTPTPGAGPITPQISELSDVTRAVYQLYIVQNLISQAHDEALRQLRALRREFEAAPTRQRVAMVSMATVVAGSLVTIIVANQETRRLAFDLIKGHDIPVPGVEGLSFQILDRGIGVTSPLGIPGLSGTARVQTDSYNFSLSFDVMAYINSR